MRHLLIIALRNLKKAVFTTSLNLIGLVSAFTAFIIIMLYVWNEHQFDHYNTNFENIYRLELKSPENPKTSVYMLGPTGKTLMNDIPEILNSTIIMPWGKRGEAVFKWETAKGETTSFEDYSFCDENVTSIFTFNFVDGQKISPLKEPQTAIISASFARKAWGTTNPIGRQIKNDTTNYTIKAVYEDLPQNSVIQCPIILKMPNYGWIGESAKDWNITNYPQFILVKPGTDPKALNDKINKLSFIKDKYSFVNNEKGTAQIIARPLKELRFCDEAAETPMFSSNSKMFVDSLFWVGLLILLISVINYINFTTASLSKRIKNININRIIGCGRFSIILLFVFETVILFFGAFILAITFAYNINNIVIPSLIGFKVPFYENYMLLIFIAAACILLGIFSSLYPAFYSTARPSIETVKRYKPQSRFNFRGMLTVIQFTATIALIAISILVVKQVHFMEKADIGFNKNGIMVIQLNNELRKNLEPFENKLNSCPMIEDYAFARAVPGIAQEINTFVVDGKNCPVWFWATDSKYIQMMGFSIVQGRDFLKNSEAETGNMIINETAAKRYGWDIGKQVGNGRVVGIMKDFNFISLRDEVEPFAFWYSNTKNSYALSIVSIKLKQGDIAAAVNGIGKIYNEYSTEIPFRYFFLDDHLNLLYSKENQQVKLIVSFSLLSVIISILGILGLSVFLCQTKIKEIGIRKINGAQDMEVIAMLNKDFIKWVAIAFLIAIPLSWYAMHKWLQNFAFKTELSWWIFAAAGAIALFIALFTVTWQSWFAATKNPVESLRYE